MCDNIGLFDHLPDTLDGDDDAPTMVQADMRGRLTTAEAAWKYMLGGNARVTVRSVKTGTRFTYRLQVSEDKNTTFVSVLTDPDNEMGYTYLGTIPTRSLIYMHGRKSRITEQAASAIAFKWLWGQLAKRKLPDTVEVWHEGRCGRCYRPLTVPESIESGFGPECIKHV